MGTGASLGNAAPGKAKRSGGMKLKELKAALNKTRSQIECLEAALKETELPDSPGEDGATAAHSRQLLIKMPDAGEFPVVEEKALDVSVTGSEVEQLAKHSNPEVPVVSRVWLSEPLSCAVVCSSCCSIDSAASRSRTHFSQIGG